MHIPGPGKPIVHTEPNGPKSYEFAVTFTQLLKQVSLVRRPFHAQSLALVSVCYKLWRSFLSHEHRSLEKLVAIDQ